MVSSSVGFGDSVVVEENWEYVWKSDSVWICLVSGLKDSRSYGILVILQSVFVVAVEPNLCLKMSSLHRKLPRFSGFLGKGRKCCRCHYRLVLELGTVSEQRKS